MLFGFVEGGSVDLFAFWFSYVWAASSFVSLVVTSWVSLFVLGLFGFGLGGVMIGLWSCWTHAVSLVWVKSVSVWAFVFSVFSVVPSLGVFGCSIDLCKVLSVVCVYLDCWLL